MKLLLLKDERRTSNVQHRMKEEQRTVLDEAQFQNLTIAMQYDSSFWYSIAAQGSLFLVPTTVAAFLRLFPFDVSRLGVIGRSMFHASA